MQTVTAIGLDIAKSVFQVNGVDTTGQVVIRRQLRSRELQAPGLTVRLIPPAYVKPCVKRQKNDAADAEATCRSRPQTGCSRCAGAWRGRTITTRTGRLVPPSRRCRARPSS